MKKALLLLTALCIATLGFAQLPFATLTHNDSIRVFHGMNALQQAHAAAVGGDVINLSSGVFNSVNITKAVTIRGAGMFNNNATGLISTTIRNGFNVEVSDTNNRLSLIGLYFANGANMELRKATNPQFLKCRFQDVSQAYVSGYYTSNAQFINCIIKLWNNSYVNNTWYATGISFYNSVILDYGQQWSPDMLVNCIVNLSNNSDYINCKTIMNCILYCGSYNGNANGYTSFNTIGINTNNHTYFDLTNMGTHNLHNYTSYAQVFQTFRGTYSDGMSMALNSNIASTILGDDSTQVGIYGGQFPWDPSVSNPLIGHATAGRRTNAQGMLEVNIEILSNDEE